MKYSNKQRTTVYLHNFGQTEVISAFSCYSASATGWTFPKPPAIFATLPVRWLSFRSNSNLVVLLSISNGRTSANSLAAQILFVSRNRSLRGSLMGGHRKSQQRFNFQHFILQQKLFMAGHFFYFFLE